jgi:hypothetical protein
VRRPRSLADPGLDRDGLHVQIQGASGSQRWCATLETFDEDVTNP